MPASTASRRSTAAGCARCPCSGPASASSMRPPRSPSTMQTTCGRRSLGSASSSRSTARGGRSSGMRSSGMRRTRDCPTGGARSSTPTSATRSSPQPARTRRSRRSSSGRPLLARAPLGRGVDLRAHRGRRREGGARERRGRTVLRACARGGHAPRDGRRRRHRRRVALAGRGAGGGRRVRPRLRRVVRRGPAPPRKPDRPGGDLRAARHREEARRRLPARAEGAPRPG